MGFLDKAKKLADQAQEKLDEVQKDFNAKQGTSSPQQAPTGGAAVEYDAHGRPVSAAPSSPTPAAPPAPADKGPTIDPSAPTSPDPAPNRPHGDPLVNESGPPTPQAGRTPPEPPSSNSGLSSGDPLAG